ncbi:hypothetical protein SD457_06180 [Coprobacillaceae bacterium CR2/5/TPMF4]|nr:hypothetical protein SD457_06180 [Coprobacillaceae bacterium CR2/5/TPMF4]
MKLKKGTEEWQEAYDGVVDSEEKLIEINSNITDELINMQDAYDLINEKVQNGEK